MACTPRPHMERLSDAEYAGVPSAAGPVTVLPNGMPLLVQEDDRFPLASIRLYVHAGSAYETPENAGISHLLEHMVFKRTKNRGPGEIAKAVETAGGSINAATSFDYTTYMVDIPAENWALGLEVIQDMLFNADFDPDELAKEKEVVLAEMKRGEDTPGTKLFQSIQGSVWKSTTYAVPIIGNAETLESIQGEDLQHYIQRLYQPASMLLVVVGDVDRNRVLDKTLNLFGDLKNDRIVVPPPPLPDPAEAKPEALPRSPRVMLEHGNWNKAYMGVALPLPGFRSPKTAGLEILAHLLGGDRTSLLYRTMKYEQRLVDDVSASAVTLERTGMLYFSFDFAPENLMPFFRDFMDRLSRLSAGDFTQQELDRAKLQMEDSLFRTKETLPGLASKLGWFRFFESGPTAEEAYLHDIRSVDLEYLQELIDEYVNPALLHTALLLPHDAQGNSEELLNIVKQHSTEQKQEPLRTETAQKTDSSETIDLPGGNKLILIPDTTLPYTALDLVYQGGDALLEPNEQGLAELTSRILMKGTAKRNAVEIQEYLADRAAVLQASANRESFHIGAKYPTRFSNDMTELLLEVVAEAAFSADETDREKQNQIAAIKAREDRPLGLAFRHIFPFLFQDTGYHYFHQGTMEAVAGYSDKAVRTYWSRQKSMPWVMSVCGDFKREHIVETARRLSEIAPTTSKPFPPLNPTWSQEDTLDLTLQDRNQAHLITVFRVPPLDHPDTPSLMLLRTILAGQGGLLFNDLRDERGLAYTVTAFLWQNRSIGFLAFYIGTDPENMDESLDRFKVITEELRRQSLSSKDLQRGKNLLEGDYYLEHQRLSDRSREAASLAIQNQPIDMNTRYLKAAAAMSTEHMKETAEKYLQWDNAYLIKVLP